MAWIIEVQVLTATATGTMCKSGRRVARNGPNVSHFVDSTDLPELHEQTATSLPLVLLWSTSVSHSRISGLGTPQSPRHACRESWLFYCIGFGRPGNSDRRDDHSSIVRLCQLTGKNRTTSKESQFAVETRRREAKINLAQTHSRTCLALCVLSPVKVFWWVLALFSWWSWRSFIEGSDVSRLVARRDDVFCKDWNQSYVSLGGKGICREQPVTYSKRHYGLFFSQDLTSFFLLLCAKQVQESVCWRCIKLFVRLCMDIKSEREPFGLSIFSDALGHEVQYFLMFID